MRKTISLFIFLSLLIFEMNAQNFDELIGDHLLKNEKKYGLNKSDLKTFRLEHINNVNRNGAVTYYYQQQINDIDIQNAMLIVTLDKNNKIVHIGNSAIGHLNEVVVEDKQAISAPEAAVFAARNLGIKNPENSGHSFKDECISRSAGTNFLHQKPNWCCKKIHISRRQALPHPSTHHGDGRRG